MDLMQKYGLDPHDCLTVKVGDRFGRITILAVGKLAGQKYKYRAVYKCDCGTEAITQCGTIQIGTTRSCGCKNREDTTKHGLSASPLYMVWTHMHERCEDPTSKHFADYGGRGISVCSAWRELSAFHADMVPSYAKGLQLERINNDLGYSPDNCRWATRMEQMRNRRNNINVTLDGETKILKDWCHLKGLNYHSVYFRIKQMGWTAERALSTPMKRRASV